MRVCQVTGAHRASRHSVLGGAAWCRGARAAPGCERRAEVESQPGSPAPARDPSSELSPCLGTAARSPS